MRVLYQLDGRRNVVRTVRVMNQLYVRHQHISQHRKFNLEPLFMIFNQIDQRIDHDLFTARYFFFTACRVGRNRMLVITMLLRYNILHSASRGVPRDHRLLKVDSDAVRVHVDDGTGAKP